MIPRRRAVRSPGVAAALLASALLAVAFATGCSAGVSASAPPVAPGPPPPPPAVLAVAPPPPAVVVPPPAPAPPLTPLDPEEDPRFATAIRLDLDALRAHKIGRRMGKAIAKLEPLKALASSSLDPLRDLDKAVWLGTGDVRTSRASQVILTRTHGDELDLAVRRLAPIADDATAKKTSFEVRVGKRAANATLSPGTVTLLELGLAPFTRPLVVASKPDELVRLQMKEPGKSFPAVPRSITLGAMIVTAHDDGGATVTMTGTCTDEAAAILAQKLVAAGIQKYNVFPFRLITRKALDTAKVSHEGVVVNVDVNLSTVQVEAFARVLADEMNADLTAP